MEETHDHMCRAKMGLLFLRDCERPAKGTCTICGRPVCGQHTVKSEAGPLCPECGTRKRELRNRPSVHRTRTSRRYHHIHHYDPIYYGHHHYYSDADFVVFDEGSVIHEEQPEGAPDFDAVEEGGYDYLES